MAIDSRPYAADFSVKQPFLEVVIPPKISLVFVPYWPGDEESECAVVADASVIAELPADMIETIGTPAVVASLQEIIERIDAG